MAHVFISYVREDRQDVDRLCEGLRSQGVDVWLDRDRIAPGERWRAAIRLAIENGAFFLACFSRGSTQREATYMNEELILAIEQLRVRPADRKWFIPVRLSDCSIPSRSIGGGETLRDLQRVDLFVNWSDGVGRILSVIQPEPFSSREIGIYVANLTGDKHSTAADKITLELKKAITTSPFFEHLRDRIAIKQIGREVWGDSYDNREKYASELLKNGRAKLVVWGDWGHRTSAIHCTAQRPNGHIATETINDWGFGDISDWLLDKPQLRWLQQPHIFSSKISATANDPAPPDAVSAQQIRATKKAIHSYLGDFAKGVDISIDPSTPHFLLTRNMATSLLILIHGWNHNFVDNWMPMITRLLRTPGIGVDICSIGYQTGPLKAESVHSVSATLARVVSSFENYRAFHLISFSRGGLVVLDYLLNQVDHPTDLDRLVSAIIIGCPTFTIVDEALKDVLDEPEFISLYLPDQTGSVVDVTKARIRKCKGDKEKSALLSEVIQKLWIVSGTKDRVVDWNGKSKAYNDDLLLPGRRNLIEVPYDHYYLIEVDSPHHQTYKFISHVLQAD